MFRIRKLYDTVSLANREAVAQVLDILREQFPSARHFFEGLAETALQRTA